MTTTTPVVTVPPRDRARSLRVWFRRLVLCAFALLTLWLLYERWGVRARLQAELLLRQRECFQFVQPADRVVFEGDAGRAAALSQEPGYDPIRSRDDGSLFDAPTPAIVAALSKSPGQSVQKVEEVGTRVARYEVLHHLRPPPAFGGGIFAPELTFPIFVHERSAGAGVRRLVIVQGNWSSGVVGIQLWARVIAPAGWRTLPADLPTQVVDGQGITQDFSLRPVVDGWVRVYAGQPDPNDSAAFTFAFETPEGKGTIAGKLRADDNVELRLASWRGTPAAAPEAIAPAGQ